MIKVSIHYNNKSLFEISTVSKVALIILLGIFIIYVTPGSSFYALAINNMNDTNHRSHDVSFIGTISSNPETFHNTGLEQSFFIFPVKNESTTYSGVLTFASSKPVQIQSINILTINNSLKLPVQFGTLYTFPVNGTVVIPSNLLDEPKNTGSVLFSGNGLRIITNEPFLVSYSFSGKEFYSITKNDIESALEVYRELTGTYS
jgi:uncharacterized membrane protein